VVCAALQPDNERWHFPGVADEARLADAGVAPAFKGGQHAGRRYRVPDPGAAQARAQQESAAWPQHPADLGRVAGPALRFQVVEAAAVNDERERTGGEGQGQDVGPREQTAVRLRRVKSVCLADGGPGEVDADATPARTGEIGDLAA
jgi:hypothetical protein